MPFYDDYHGNWSYLPTGVGRFIIIAAPGDVRALEIHKMLIVAYIYAQTHMNRSHVCMEQVEAGRAGDMAVLVVL